MAIATYRDVMLSGVYYRPAPIGRSASGISDDLAYLAPFIEPLVIDDGDGGGDGGDDGGDPGAGGGGEADLRQLHPGLVQYTQRARLRPMQQEDEYGWLIARQGTPKAAKRGAHKLTATNKLMQPAAHRVTMIAMQTDDEFGSLKARRGLPNLKVLTMFLNHISRGGR